MYDVIQSLISLANQNLLEYVLNDGEQREISHALTRGESIVHYVVDRELHFSILGYRHGHIQHNYCHPQILFDSVLPACSMFFHVNLTIAQQQHPKYHFHHEIIQSKV